MLNASGARKVVTEGDVAHAPEAIAWSPDGRRLLYVTRVDGEEGPAPTQPSAYHVWNDETGETLHLGPELPGYPSEVEAFLDYAWSPSSTRILFRASSQESPPGTWVLDVNAPRMWRISSQSPSAATWTAEDHILYTVEGQEGRPLAHLVSIGPPSQVHTQTLELNGPTTLSPGRRHVARLNIQGGGGQQLQVFSLPDFTPLTLSTQPSVAGIDEAPLWSPDGRWIAYRARAADSSEDQEPLTIVADTKGIYETLVVDAFVPQSWSPDGRLLAGASCSDTACSPVVAGISSLLGEAPARGTTRSLNETGEDLQLWDQAWSPRGVYLAYSVTGLDAEPEGLALWNRATGERRLLIPTEHGSSFTDLQWSPDGCRLYTARRQEDGAVSEIWAVGPAWEDRWQVASTASSSSALLTESSGPPESEPRPCPGSPLTDRRLIAYYGTPLGPGLGILGRHNLTNTLTLLDEQAQVYRDLDPDIETIPVFHMVTTIADDFPGSAGDYNHRVSHEIINRWVEGAKAAGGWSVLDVQPGRANLAEEIHRLETLLLEPTVHLAVDPEFIVSDQEVPGEDLGRITGPQLNLVQARVDQIGRAIGQRKMLVVHQFDDRMIEQKDAVLDYPFVELVWDADGFGTPGSKISDYDQYRTETGFEYGGFKLFYNYDVPLMTEAQVLALDPPPVLVIYQ